MMINSIIFSKDKAVQLRLLLESIKKNTDGIFNLTVIYSASKEEFDKGYEKLKLEDVSTGVKWIQQTEFKNNVLQALQTNADHSCFFMDDDVMYGKFDTEKILKTLKEDQDVFCFSLRLGMNTKFCYRLGTGNNLQSEEHVNGVIKWDWTKNYLDYGYPLSLNGHLFRTRDIMKLTKQVGFKSPEELEDALQVFDTFPKFKMAAYEKNILVNVTQKNSNAKVLNEKYLEHGSSFKFDEIKFDNIIGCSHDITPVEKTTQDA